MGLSYGRARKALNGRKRRFPARAEERARGEAGVEELNCAYADRRSLGRYLFFGKTGISEDDFHRISNSQNRPLFELSRDSPDPNGPIYANAIGRFF